MEIIVPGSREQEHPESIYLRSRRRSGVDSLFRWLRSISRNGVGRFDDARFVSRRAARSLLTESKKKVSIAGSGVRTSWRSEDAGEPG